MASYKQERDEEIEKGREEVRLESWKHERVKERKKEREKCAERCDGKLETQQTYQEP